MASWLDLLDNLLELLYLYLLLYLVFLHYGNGLITFLKPHEPTSVSLNFSSTASSPLLDFIELKRVRVLLWITFWLKGMLWLVWSSNQTTKTFPISTITVSLSYHLCVHWSFTFNFFQELFHYIHNLVQKAEPSAYFCFWHAFLPKLNHF